MGLIRAAVGSVSSVLGDQFKEYVTCPTVDEPALIIRGTVNHGSGNKHATEGVISNGSKIVVPSGFAMMIIDNGAIKEFTAEPGEFIWDTSSEPSIFEGGFFKGLGESIKRIGSRITYGGQAAKDQRVYYINLLNITGNKFGSSNTETIVDPVYGSVEITFFGEYSFKVTDPAVLVANVIGANAKDVVTVDEVVGGQLKLQFASNVSTCISTLMIDNNISFNVVQKYKNEVVKVMNDLLDESWVTQYGLTIQDMALNINASEESKQIIREVDSHIAQLRREGQVFNENPMGQAGAAYTQAMRAAANNEGGAMMGFMGMGMAQEASAKMMNEVSKMQENMTAGAVATSNAPASITLNPSDVGFTKKEDVPSVPEEPTPEAATQATTAKFCSNCGTPVSGNFCSECGSKIA